MTPEWRCRKCGHEWDVVPDAPSTDLFDGLTPMPQPRGNRFRSCVLYPIVFVFIFAVASGITDAIQVGVFGVSGRNFIDFIVGIGAAILITKLFFGERNNK